MGLTIPVGLTGEGPRGGPKYKPAKNPRDKVIDEYVITLVDGADMDSVVDE
jgi:hypothetical protein